ncbi:AhpC/TSA family protein [Lutibacter oricola]|uniref:AhpC/TSA family protein n=1 Tax=Lutibacter oricola TaxID=762486 RepID=A0A1H2SXH8_9FLAO|nr:TlpA disulfide reductase family protein [Lutibacter oricola]SDW36290.1 AhpC/TSA family protein [Lutibacter oricola]
MKKIILLITVLLSCNFLSYSQNSLPNLSLKTIDGKTINLVDFGEKDQVVVYSFWATWCVPCINELDAINDEYEDWTEETNFKLIAVATDNARTSSRIKPLVNGKEWEYEILLDTNQDFKRAINANTIPHIIIVKNNKILYTHSGYTPGSEIELYEKIKELAE